MNYWMIAQIFLRNYILIVTLYQNQLLEPGVWPVVNSSKIKFELYGDLVDKTYSRYNTNIIENQDPVAETENNEKGEVVYSTVKVITIQSQTETLQFQVFAAKNHGRWWSFDEYQFSKFQSAWRLQCCS